MDIVVKHNLQDRRFEVMIGSDLAFLEYKFVPGGLNLIHTYVPKAHEGQGIASQLVKEAIKYADSKDLKFKSTCPYVRDYMMKKCLFSKMM